MRSAAAIVGAPPPVSIAMPVYNCERYVSQSLESLLGQTFGDFELVISDNASSDGTEAICRDFAGRDARIRYVRRETNIGGPGNFRYVFSLCRGALHKWSTADDYWAPEFLAQALDALRDRPDAVLCYPMTRLIDADGRPLSDYQDNLDLGQPAARERFNALLSRIGLCNAHLGLIRRAAMAKTRLIGSEYNSDTHFLAELSLYGKFLLLPEIMFFRRMHETSSSWKRDDDAHQKAYYAPTGKRAARLQTWQKTVQLQRAVWRAPLPLSEKLGLAKDLARRAVWERRVLIKELAALVPGRPTSWPGLRRNLR